MIITGNRSLGVEGGQQQTMDNRVSPEPFFFEDLEIKVVPKSPTHGVSADWQSRGLITASDPGGGMGNNAVEGMGGGLRDGDSRQPPTVQPVSHAQLFRYLFSLNSMIFPKRIVSERILLFAVYKLCY